MWGKGGGIVYQFKCPDDGDGAGKLVTCPRIVGLVGSSRP